MAASNSKPSSRRWQFGDCEYLELSRTLIVKGRTVKMEPKPLEVLVKLLEAANKVVSKEQFLDDVWSDVKTTDQSLAVAITKLRKHSANIPLSSTSPASATALVFRLPAWSRKSACPPSS